MRIDTSHWVNQKEIKNYLDDIKRFEVLSRLDESALIEKIKRGDEKAKESLIRQIFVS